MKMGISCVPGRLGWLIELFLCLKLYFTSSNIAVRDGTMAEKEVIVQTGYEPDRDELPKRVNLKTIELPWFSNVSGGGADTHVTLPNLLLTPTGKPLGDRR
jgi:hypothetical protein